MYEIRHYITQDANDPYLNWWRKLRDVKARIAIDRRVNRLELGNFGDHKFCREGVWELRVDVGAGYRVCRRPVSGGPRGSNTGHRRIA